MTWRKVGASWLFCAEQMIRHSYESGSRVKPLSADVSNVSVNFGTCAVKTKCLPSPPERSHECVHSRGHQYYISSLVPSPERVSALTPLRYHHCWEVGGARLINSPFFSVVTPDLNGSSVRWIMLSGTCACLGGVCVGGGERSLCSQVKPVTMRMVYCVSVTWDKEGEPELLFSALLESHILKMTRNKCYSWGEREWTLVVAQEEKKQSESATVPFFTICIRSGMAPICITSVKNHLLNVFLWFHSSEAGK